MKKYITLVGLAFLTGCAMSDTDVRSAYAGYYKQTRAEIARFKEKIEHLTVEQLAVKAAQKDRKRMKGQARLQVDEYIYIEDIFAENNAVIFKYSLTDRWNALSQNKKNKYQQLMQKDLIYRTCSLQTVRLSQEKGLVEVHHYYDKYPMHILFTLNANKQLCVMSGF